MSPRAPLLYVVLTTACASAVGGPVGDATDTDILTPTDSAPQSDDDLPADDDLPEPSACAAIVASALEPKVFWPKPKRAYPGIPYSYTMVAYDEDGDDLCFTLESAPTGMTIDGDGTITWSPTIADNGVHPFVVHITTTKGGHKAVSVELDVTTEGFVFASLEGAADGSGTLDDPYPTIERGLQELKPDKAKTLIIRGGTYSTHWVWETGGVASPTRGTTFTEAAPGEVYAYPGESVIIACQPGSHGIWLYTSRYMIVRDLEVRGANADERGGALTHGEHLVFQRVTVRDSSWSNQNNCSGFLLHGVDIVAHRCAAHDNYDRTDDSPRWNSANYLTYADDDPPPSIYVIDSVSSGSAVGFKVKHAGHGAIVFHRVYDEGSDQGFGGMDDELSVRYGTFVGNDNGIYVGMSDPNAYTAAGNIRIEHNTVVRPTATAFSLQHSYVPTGPLTVTYNLFYVDQPFGNAEGEQWMYDILRYAASPTLTALAFENNCLDAPSDTSGFRMGSTMRSWADWRAAGKDTTSVWGDPLFVGASDFHLQAASPCRSNDGSVAGAWR